MSFRFRQSFRLWKGASISWSAPLRAPNGSAKPGGGCTLLMVAGLCCVGFLMLVNLIGHLGGRTTQTETPNSYPASFAPQNSPTQVPAQITEQSGLGQTQSAPISATNTNDIGSAQPITPPSTTSTTKEETINLRNVDPEKLHETMGLAAKGFTLNRNAETSRLFWTWRKTDATREYTCVFLADDLGAVRAITMELVDTSGQVDLLGKNYFKTVLAQILPAKEAAEAESWLKQVNNIDSVKNFAGLDLSIAHTANTHRRLTLHPKQ